MSGKWLPMHMHGGEVSELTGWRSVPPKIACPKNIPAFVVCYTKKKHEVLDFINQMASAKGFVCFCARGPIINMVCYSWKRQHRSNDSIFMHKIAG